MRIAILLTGIVLITGLASQKTVYDFSIPTPDGNELSLNAFQGKKIMFFILPSTMTSDDTALLMQIDSLSLNFRDSVSIIGVPSYEDNYSDEESSDLFDFYHSILNEDIMLAGGMYTRKTTSNQSPLFNFFTHAEENDFFDEDVTGVGEKFFVDTTGQLTGISKSNAEFTAETFKNMIN